MGFSIGQNPLVCQCLSLLPAEELDCPLMDYGLKLSTQALIKVFITAQLDDWESYADMEEKIRAHPVLLKELGVDTISGSQLSRRVNALPTELVQRVFEKVISKVRDLTKHQKGISRRIGLLKIVDSTEIKLPKDLCYWSWVSKGHNAVKMHTRLVIVSDDTSFPDKIVPSTATVSDFESSDVMIEADDATYVMDRGYPSKRNLDSWLEKKVSFVVRITKNLQLYTIEENEVTHPDVLCDKTVHYGVSKEDVRYIEFQDDKKRIYRILTTRFDLSAEEIMEIYRNRWAIELFFKWIKGHLRYKQIWSTKPQGIWNQMFIALIALGLSLILKLKLRSRKTTWNFFRLVRTYLYLPGTEMVKELNRKKKKSKGRRKIPIPKERPEPYFGDIALVKIKGKKKTK